MRRLYFTAKGLAELKKAKESLLKDRVHAVSELKKAREMGDLSENGYYKASKMKLGFIDRQLREITYKLKYATVIHKGMMDIVQIGSTVTLEIAGEHVTYDIVGEYEADPRNGRISNISPLGKALLGKKVGESVEIAAPAGTSMYTIEKIS